jgi:hypothetical protein
MGIYASSYLFGNNIVKYNGSTGIYNLPDNVDSIIKGNIIENNNGYGIYNTIDSNISANEIINNLNYGIYTSYLSTFTENNIFGNMTYDFYYTGIIDQVATNNYWGTTNSSEIMAHIYDYWDDISLGKVIYEPFAASPFSIIIDSDNDGLPDDIENDFCTDPFNADSDYDGIIDGIEDANQNGIVDNGETNPCIRDTDGDGLDDGVEDANQNGIVDSGETNPRNGDTDGDGMPDGWEVQYGLDPLVDDASEDADGDGFSNLIEYRRRTDPKDSENYPSVAMPWIPLLLDD